MNSDPQMMKASKFDLKQIIVYLAIPIVIDIILILIFVRPFNISIFLFSLLVAACIGIILIYVANFRQSRPYTKFGNRFQPVNP